MAKYNEFVEYSRDLQDFVMNGCLELLLLGVAANALVQRYLIDDCVFKLGDEWDDQEEEGEDEKEQSQSSEDSSSSD